MEPFCNHAKIISWKFEVNNLKNVWEDRFLMKLYFFDFLVWVFHKEPIEIGDLDPLYLENCFEFLKTVKTTGSLVKGVCVTFARRDTFVRASVLHEGSLFHEGTLLHGDSFARASLLHGGSLLHEATLLHGITFARRDTFARRQTEKKFLFCTEHLFLNTF